MNNVLGRKRFEGAVVWIVVGWAHSSPRAVVFSSTAEQRWHWTKKSALVELAEARKRWTGTNWMVVKMVTR